MTYIITAGIFTALLAILGAGILDRVKNPARGELSDRPVAIEDLGTIEDFDSIEEYDSIDDMETVIGWE